MSILETWSHVSNLQKDNHLTVVNTVTVFDQAAWANRHLLCTYIEAGDCRRET